jgi:hypothetical protein
MELRKADKKLLNVSQKLKKSEMVQIEMVKDAENALWNLKMKR